MSKRSRKVAFNEDIDISEKRSKGDQDVEDEESDKSKVLPY